MKNRLELIRIYDVEILAQITSPNQSKGKWRCMWSSEQLTRQSGMKSLTDGRVKGPENKKSKYTLETGGGEECLPHWEYSLLDPNNFRENHKRWWQQGQAGGIQVM